MTDIETNKDSIAIQSNNANETISIAVKSFSIPETSDSNFANSTGNINSHSPRRASVSGDDKIHMADLRTDSSQMTRGTLIEIKGNHKRRRNFE